jgi:predicted  nucleic acid-binding Zn-ribbon protein
MPHICTRCNNVFHKGEDILKGCPVCGWKKFLFTRKDPEDAEESVKGATITKAMGVRIPPRAELIVNDGKIGVTKGRDITQQIIPHAMVQKEIKPSSLQNKANLDAKDEAKVESIRITAPGTYELNLPTLFDREELIMAVKEGTYLIDLTSAFRKSKKE